MQTRLRQSVVNGQEGKRHSIKVRFQETLMTSEGKVSLATLVLPIPHPETTLDPSALAGKSSNTGQHVLRLGYSLQEAQKEVDLRTLTTLALEFSSR